MKKSLIFCGIILSNFCVAQTPWNTKLNTITSTDGIGTVNAMPLSFYTNNTLKMTLQTNGRLTLNNLSGSGNRILFADANGNLSTLPAASASQVLLGSGDWGNLPSSPWLQTGSRLSYPTGFVGIGNNDPHAELDVTGQGSFSDKLFVGKQMIMGSSGNQVAFDYTPGTGTTPSILRIAPANATIGVITNPTYPNDPTPDPNCVYGNYSVITAFQNIISVATNTTSTSNTGGNIILGHNGLNAFLETQGTGTVSANHPGDLFINKGCKRNVHMFNYNTTNPFGNTLTSVFSVYGQMNVTRNMQLGDATATAFTDNFTKLYISSNGNPYGIKVRHGGSNGAGVKVIELDSIDFALQVTKGAGASEGPDRFTVQGNGKTTVTSTSPNALVIMNPTSGIPSFLTARNGNDSRIWTVNPISAYSFGIDNAGTGHIGVNINAPVNLINFKPDAGNNPQVWIGNMKQASGTHTDFRLAVDGKIVAKSCYITVNNWADYVFSKDYRIPSLYDIEAYYTAHHHLPEIPSNDEVKEKGIDIGEMNKLLLQKIEEITILMVQQQKEIDTLKSRIK